MSASRPTLIVLPGWGHDRAVWDSFLDRFPAGSAQVIELPGFGTEPLVSSDWGVPEYVAWTKKKIESKGLQKVILLGHSFGGRVAASLASEQPMWLSGLILYAAPVLYRPSLLVKLRIFIARLLKPVVPKRMRIMLGETVDSAEAADFGMRSIFKRTIPCDLTNKLPSIAVPTLLLWGARDTYPPRSIAEEASELIPSSSLTVIEGAGHTAHLEKPDLFYGHVSRFIDAH